MNADLLFIHSVLRWLILALLLITLLQAFGKNAGIRSTSLFLVICTHLQFLIGLYQISAGRFGWMNVPKGVDVMKDTFYRFYLVEHPFMMLIAVILITIARSKAKVLNYRATSWLLLIALIVILAAVPWPFRGIPIGRPWAPTSPF